MDLSLTFAPPPASGAGATRRINLLILLKPPQTAALRVAAQLWVKTATGRYFTPHGALCVSS